MKRDITRDWYQPKLTFFTFLLLPFSWLFFGIVAIRRYLYRIHLKKKYVFSVPVIVVGNITVGGTGKTPFVMALAKQLLLMGFYPGIVSRGVGGKKLLKPVQVHAYSDPEYVGDESLLLARHSQCPVYVCVDRVSAVKQLLSNHPQCNVILSDDGLQHYRLGRSIEIVIVDGGRAFGNGRLLPAGPLREPISRILDADFVVKNGASDNNGYVMELVADTIVSVKDISIFKTLEEFENKIIHAVAGIGNPNRFFNFLRRRGFDVIEHVFPDHYHYTLEELNFSDNLPIVMTEKDAVKCETFADERFWYVPVVGKINADFWDAFKTLFLQLKKEKK